MLQSASSVPANGGSRWVSAEQVTTIVDARVAECQECSRRSFALRTVVIGASIAALATVGSAVFNVWTQYSSREAVRPMLAGIEASVAATQHQIGVLSNELYTLRDSLRRDVTRLERKVDKSEKER